MPNAKPQISIIVPALNEEKLLAQTLACFPREMRERYALELIVSDGASSDNSVEIARQHADVVIEHHSPEPQTIAEGRNCGASVARGELLVFINADTVPSNPEAFVAALQRINQQSGYVAFAGPVEIAPTQRQFFDRLFHRAFNRYVQFLNFIRLGMARGECQIVRREAFLAVGGYRNYMAAGEDFDLYKRLARIGRIAYVPQLKVYESPRRFRRYGYLRVFALWSLNGIAVLLFRRSYSKKWEEIR